MGKKPVIAITAGDPAGIGPEIIKKALARPEISRRASFLVLGDISGKKFKPGSPGAGSGRASIDCIDEAVSLIKKCKADALVTAPISKFAASSAGFKFPGHTEYLAYLTNTKKFCMMLVGGSLRVVLVTRHIALKDVSKKLNSVEIYDAIILTAVSLKEYFKIKNPRIAVCALNPHAGENGLFSDEEKRIIMPAIKKASRKLKNITGPLPADSLFYNANKGLYDAEIAMYHDQGLIPLKMTARDASVNITLGLPFIRTSPAHGTAFDIAGKGIADPSSMIEAIKLACQLTAK